VKHCRTIELRRASVRVRDVGEGPVVVFTPDCPSVIEHYEALQDQLARERRVVCFDMPGFGFSRARSDYDFGLSHGADVVIELLDELRIEKAALAFSCANGFYALAAARSQPDRVERLVLAQTPSIAQMHVWADRQVPRVLRVPRLGQAFMRVLRRPAASYWYRMAVAKGRSPRSLQRIADEALARGGRYELADMVQGLLPTRDAQVEGVTAPTTVIWGERDRSHGHAPPDTLLGHVPHARLVRFEEAGHFPDLELPDRYARVLLDALA
jgi:pimeloyl-ACP methyl ester carboxylesterase